MGIAKWAKLKEPDDKYDKYTIDVYLTPGSWETFKKSGLGLKVRENEEGEYVKFSRNHTKNWKNENVVLGPPKVLIRDGEEYRPFDDLIGNGSLVTCKVQVYNTRKGPGHTLEVVSVENLIPYKNNQNVNEEGVEMPF